MATVQTNVSEQVYSIKRWLGVNEAEEGDATLKTGEAAVCRNFKVTDGGALKKRGGTRRVMELKAKYNVEVCNDACYEITEFGEAEKRIALYPRAAVDDDGGIFLEGERILVGFEDADKYRYYYTDAPKTEEGELFRFDGAELTPRKTVRTTSTKYAGETSPTPYTQIEFAWFCLYDGIAWDGTRWKLENPQICSVTAPGEFDGKKYSVLDSGGNLVSIFATISEQPTEEDFVGSYNTEGRFCKVKSEGNGYIDPEAGEGHTWELLLSLSEMSEAKYTWRFYKLYSEPNASESAEVKALWSGFVNGREVLCAAGNGHLWELFYDGGAWEKASCGSLDTSGTVHLFGFDEKLYILNGSEYKAWDGAVLSNVEGYRPLVSVAAVPEGGGTNLEQVNKLTGARRAWFSPDGVATEFHLPETGVASVDWVKDLVTGEEMTEYEADPEAGTVTLPDAPARGVNTLEIAWTHPVNFAESIKKMRFSELYNGAQDTRVFLYGDGSNECFYSGLDHEGVARADYFPDLNECAVGASNTPITAMIRHYNQLLCFKLDSTWTIAYNTLTLADGSVTAGFNITPVNRDVGSCAYGEARLVENRPRTLDGRSVIEWKANSYGNISGDTRNAERVSQRVNKSIYGFDLTKARTFYDKITHEYYVIGEDGNALVHNVEADAWYTYTGFNARCMINYRDEVYYGTADGYLLHFSDNYLSDNGREIDAYWESGAMDFSADFKRKYSAMLWVGIRPDEDGYLEVSAETDRKTDFVEYPIEAVEDGAVPKMARVKLKAKKFTYYKLIFANCSADSTALIVSADIRVRGTGYVR